MVRRNAGYYRETSSYNPEVPQSMEAAPPRCRLNRSRNPPEEIARIEVRAILFRSY
ncbi:hypothetical protein SS05631_c03800 [Sinorhizobium sp. CCBAU 05631]|nr:hypothetical protein SS05631_c03800 [Sinorhizobium sp. CCBAU 05631]